MRLGALFAPAHGSGGQRAWQRANGRPPVLPSCEMPTASGALLIMGCSSGRAGPAASRPQTLRRVVTERATACFETFWAGPDVLA